MYCTSLLCGTENILIVLFGVSQQKCFLNYICINFKYDIDKVIVFFVSFGFDF